MGTGGEVARAGTLGQADLTEARAVLERIDAVAVGLEVVELGAEQGRDGVGLVGMP